MLARPTVVVITALTVCVGLTACSSGSASSSAAVAAGAVADSATPSPPDPASTSSVSSSPGTTTARGRCSMIDQPTAEGILGFTTKPGLSSPTVSTGQMKKLDGCAYQNLASGSLGYSVIQVDASIGAAMVAAAKGRMSGAGAQVSMFDAGMPDSIGFTQKLPFGVDSQITVLVGDRLIAVASTRKDGDVPKSRAAAVAAAQKLATSA
jgi:hypothetical protein